MTAANTCYVGGMQRFSTEDGPGIRTTVFLKGCPLRCAWCHNPELISDGFYLMYRDNTCIQCGACVEICPEKAIHFDKEGLRVDYSKCTECLKCVEACCSESLYTKAKLSTVDEIMEEVKRDMDFYERSGGGVTLSGGEVLSHGEFACAIAERCREKQISVAVDTSGFGSYEKLRKLAELADVILYDLKHMDVEKHKIYTGQKPGLIWDNLIRLSEEKELRNKVIIRVPLIHNVNDDEENLRRLCTFMTKHQLKEVNFLPYHNMGILKGRRVGIEQDEFETPPDEALDFIRELFEAQNIQTVILGNEK